jgi:hypothetical protein
VLFSPRGRVRSSDCKPGHREKETSREQQVPPPPASQALSAKATSDKPVPAFSFPVRGGIRATTVRQVMVRIFLLYRWLQMSSRPALPTSPTSSSPLRLKDQTTQAAESATVEGTPSSIW